MARVERNGYVGRLLCADGDSSKASGACAERGGLDFPHNTAWRIGGDRWLDLAASLDLQARAGREAAISRLCLELRFVAVGRHAHLGTIGSSRDLRSRRVF